MEDHKLVIEQDDARTTLDARVWERVSETEFRNRHDKSRLTLLPPEEVRPGCTPWVYTDPCGFRWAVGR